MLDRDRHLIRFSPQVRGTLRLFVRACKLGFVHTLSNLSTSFVRPPLFLVLNHASARVRVRGCPLSSSLTRLQLNICRNDLRFELECSLAGSRLASGTGLTRLLRMFPLMYSLSNHQGPPHTNELEFRKSLVRLRQ